MKGRGAAWTDRHARLSSECRRQRLERRYRRLLALYPKEHRREHADEMIGVLLASTSHAHNLGNTDLGNTDLGTTRFAHLADVADLIAGAFRIRTRSAMKRLQHAGALRGTVKDQRWSDALAVVSVVAPLLLLVAMLAQFNVPQAAASTVTGQPYWPLTGSFYVLDWPLTIGAPLVAVLAFARLRRLAGLAALATAVSQLSLLPAQSIASFASPALAFSVLLGTSAGVALLLSPGAVRGLALLRWWGIMLIGIVALILGGFSLGGFSLGGYLLSNGAFASAIQGSVTTWSVLPPAELTGLVGDLLIAGILTVVAFGCLFTPVGRRVLALFAIPMIPYAYIWADKLGADLIWHLGEITAISSSALMLYLPPALIACLIVAGTRRARRRTGPTGRVAS